MHDVFEQGYVDVAIFQPTYLTDFYKHGFNTTAQDAPLKERYPDRFILNSSFDPRGGEAGLHEFEQKVRRWDVKGVKLYTAEWRGDSRGWKLTDDAARIYLGKCQELGVKNIHVHKGPTIWPLNKDAFNVEDVDAAATEFPDLNFIVEHCGLPRLEDFCWIATQEPNVYGGLAVAMPFIHTRPRYFAEVLGELLYWIGEDRIQFSSDYALWTPKWLIEKFVDFQIPADMTEYAPLTPDVKRKILGLNAAKMYGIPVPDYLAAEIPARPEVGVAVGASS
jgi:predicted TIM-barrel fold metal-dependent hydrolase